MRELESGTAESTWSLAALISVENSSTCGHQQRTISKHSIAAHLTACNYTPDWRVALRLSL